MRDFFNKHTNVEISNSSIGRDQSIFQREIDL